MQFFNFWECHITLVPYDPPFLTVLLYIKATLCVSPLDLTHFLWIFGAYCVCVFVCAPQFWSGQ